MNFYSSRLITAFLTFTIGVWAAFSSLIAGSFYRAETAMEPLKTFALTKPAPKDSSNELDSQLTKINPVEPPLTPKITARRRHQPISITKFENFESVILLLKKIAAFEKNNGRQTFYISKVRFDDNRNYAYAYWQQDNSIIVLDSPAAYTDEPSASELYWLSYNARIDLKKDVVPKELGNMGCCSVTKVWANEVLGWCRTGYKLSFNLKAATK